MKITDANVIICFGFAKLILQNRKVCNLQLSVLDWKMRFEDENNKCNLTMIHIKLKI